ncbi:MAG TPA: O-antigen ligase family protein [Pseudobacteroides sp.]|uniref:O-antigen ligase family protein n=1 Tax=Pseudobacteroides sp. TaxID=1968840 RepID=UPI002F927849
MKQKKLPLDIEKYKVFRIILITIICIFMFFPPFLRGMYFEAEQIPAEIFIFIVFTAFWAYKFLIRDKRLLVTPIDYAALAFTVIYFISILLFIIGIRVAVAPRLAVIEWLKYCMYIAVFIMLSDLILSMKSKLAVLWVIVGTTVGICIIGFDGAAGGHIAKLINFITNSETIFGTFVTHRIYSTLQYPNALASYLIAVFMISLTLSIITKNRWLKIIPAVCSFIFLTTFVFTQSRGMIAVTPFIALIYIIALPKGNRIKGIIYGVSSIIPVGSVSLLMHKYIMNNDGNGSKIWLLLFAGIVISAIINIIISFVSPVLEKLNWKIYASAAALCAIAAIVAVVISMNSTEKLELVYPEGTEGKVVSSLKSVILKPGRDYTLVYDVDAKIKGDKPSAYSIIINYKRQRDLIVNEREVPIIQYNGPVTKGVEKRELEFKLPSDSKVVNITFRNDFSGTSSSFDNVKVVDKGTGNVVKNIAMNYKYPLGNIVEKVEMTQLSRSLVERSIFNKDAVEMFKDRWLLGGGGGTWAALNFYYQSFLYWSTQAHNYFTQVAVECGVVGIIVLLFLLISIVVMFVSEYKYKRKSSIEERILQAALFAAVLGMLMHSAADFDFSLSAVFLLFWQLLGLFNSRYRNTPIEEIETNSTIVNSLDRLIKIKTVNLHGLVLLTISVVILFIPVFIKSAGGMGKDAVSVSATNVDEAISRMKSAAGFDPWMAEYKLDYVNLLLLKKQKTQEDINNAKDVLEEAEKIAWNSVEFLPKIGSFYLQVGEIDKGLTLFDRATKLRPFRPEEWQQSLGAYYSVANYYILNKDKTKAATYIDKGLKLLDEFFISNKRNLNPAVLTASGQEHYENLRYMKENQSKIGISKINKLAFYYLKDLDSDKDGYTDQFNLGVANTTLNVKDNGILEVQGINGAKDGYLETRRLNLTEEKIYRIEVELDNEITTKVLPYTVTGLGTGQEGLVAAGKVYSAQISVPKDFKPSDNVLRIGVPERLEIKGIRIVEL